MKYLFLIASGFLFTSCHVYYRGVVINKTTDTLMVVTKPSLMVFEKDSYYQDLKARNKSNHDSVFITHLLPFDTLYFNSGPSYSTSLSLLEYLKIESQASDIIVLNSNKAVRKNTEIVKRGFYKALVGIVITDPVK